MATMAPAAKLETAEHDSCTESSPGATLPGAVPIPARRRKTVSRRVGQNGSIEVRDGAYRGRWLDDVAGQARRVRRSVVLGFTKEMTKSEARRKLRSIIEATGINSPTM